MKTLTAVLFAGGESRRMGADKATLVLHGEPLWSRQLRLLRELEPQQVLISARSRPAWCPPEIAVVLDASPARGPLSGLAAVLAGITTTHALVLAVDLPLIEAAFLSALWAGCEAASGRVPSNGGNLEPLCAIYPATAAGLVGTALAGENFSLRQTIEVLCVHQLMQVVPLAPAVQPTFFNVNSPTEFARLIPSLTLQPTQDGGGGRSKVPAVKPVGEEKPRAVSIKLSPSP